MSSDPWTGSSKSAYNNKDNGIHLSELTIGIFGQANAALTFWKKEGFILILIRVAHAWDWNYVSAKIRIGN